jgi:hypothetical protein
MKKFLCGAVFSLLSVMALAEPLSVSFSWVAPTQNVDGSPLAASEISHYILYRGTTPGLFTEQTPNIPGVDTAYVWTIDTSLGETSRFVITATDTAGNESANSNEITLLYSDDIPPESPESVNVNVFCPPGRTCTVNISGG